MSPDHWSKLTWDTVSAGGYDLFGPIGYLDRKRDRAYKQRVIVTPAKKKIEPTHDHFGGGGVHGKACWLIAYKLRVAFNNVYRCILK